MVERSTKLPAEAPARRRVTLADVATAAGVGRTCVSDILNRNVTEKYPEATRKRVHEAVQMLGYVPDRAAQQMARGRSGLLGLVLTRSLTDPYYARLADAAERIVWSHRLELQIAVTHGDRRAEAARVRQMQGNAVEGLIIGPVYEPLDLAEHRELLRSGLPTVVFGRRSGSEFDEVDYERAVGWELLRDHLMERGHRRIGFLCAPPSRANANEHRYRTLDVLQSVGLYREEWVVWQADTGRVADYRPAVEAAANRWAALPVDRRPSAVLCNNDLVAMVALSAFARAGLRVPQDISIVGRNNLPETELFVPALTTLDTCGEEQMQVAVELLLARVAQADLPRQTRLVRPRLIVRESVAPV